MPYRVAVRTLCDFTAKEGDLDLRFSASPSARQGIAGHRTVASRRGPPYRAEVALSGSHRHLVVRGRADGYDPETQTLEEVKTCAGDPGRVPANHRQRHWAQAQVYGWLLCRESGLEALTVSLVYFDILSQQETVLARHCTAHALRRFFEALCERFLAWADAELAHRAGRDRGLAALAFPHAAFRRGQRALAVSVFRAAALGRCLVAQAPTGIGKTVATLFPLLKAAPAHGLDKVFVLSAKGSGSAVALEAMATLRRGVPGAGLRVLELVARDKACEHPGLACHGESCPLARGFFDRLPAARAAAVALPSLLDRPALRQVALEHRVCPYHLGQELVRWSDVVVADYNHWFDGPALLHALTVADGWRVAVLVDEAHNLVERARAMYSAELDEDALRRAALAAPAALRPPLGRLRRAWRELTQDQAEPYRSLPECPRGFASALRDATAALTSHFAARAAGGAAGTVAASAGAVVARLQDAADGPLLRLYFDLLRFARLLDSFGGHSLFDVTLAPGGTAPAPAGSGADAPAAAPGSTVCIRNVVPAPFLAPRFAAAHASVLYSATLTPLPFYTDTLGLPADAVWLDVPAPFEPAQLAVHVVRGVSTRFGARDASLAPIARVIASRYREAPGNYLAFFSSFDYLDAAAAAFGAAFPAIPSWRQARRMDEAERAAFLARFDAAGRGIGFAVLGGSFAEGVDLAGERLVGAFIVTLGLPQFNPVNQAMRDRIEARFGAGYDYTYLFPGIRKVVQAAGRVIRTPTDRGSIHLIDDRFDRPEVRRLLPAWWRLPAA